MVDENSVVDRNSEKLVDESSVVVQNTSLQPKGLDEKAVIDQSAFSLWSWQTFALIQFFSRNFNL